MIVDIGEDSPETNKLGKGSFMKARIAMLSCLLVATVVFIGQKSSWAGAQSGSGGMKVGVVSIKRIYQECKRNAKYREDAAAEQD